MTQTQWWTWLDVPQECDENDSERVGWFLSPEQHVVEFLVFSLVGWSLLRLAKSKLSQEARESGDCLPAKPDTQSRGGGEEGGEQEEETGEQQEQTTSSSSSSWLDLLITLLLTVSFAGIVAHKLLKRGGLWFLLQPCHVIHFLSLVLCMLPRKSRWSRNLSSTLFNVILCCYFAPFLGLLFADLSCYTLPLELENWFLQHALLCLLPFWWLWTRRFAVVSSYWFVFYAFAISFIYHYTLVTPISLWSHSNINFVVCPPGPLKAAGRAFRWLTPFVMVSLQFFLRLGLLGTFCRAMGIPQDSGRVTGSGCVRPQRSRKAKAKAKQL